MYRPAHARRRDLIGAALLLPALKGCGGGGGGGGGGFLTIVPIESPPVAPPAPSPPSAAPPPSPPPSVEGARVDMFTLEGPGGRNYPISVYVPATASGEALTSIYVTDADVRYSPSDTRFNDFRQVLEATGRRALLIGIGNAAFRGTDYTLPGAVPYHDFLAKQVLPLIESRYKCDPERRMSWSNFVGHLDKGL